MEKEPVSIVPASTIFFIVPSFSKRYALTLPPSLDFGTLLDDVSNLLNEETMAGECIFTVTRTPLSASLYKTLASFACFLG